MASDLSIFVSLRLSVIFKGRRGLASGELKQRGTHLSSVAQHDDRAQMFQDSSRCRSSRKAIAQQAGRPASTGPRRLS